MIKNYYTNHNYNTVDLSKKLKILTIISSNYKNVHKQKRIEIVQCSTQGVKIIEVWNYQDKYNIKVEILGMWIIGVQLFNQLPPDIKYKIILNNLCMR